MWRGLETSLRRLVRHCQRKRGATDRPHLRNTRWEHCRTALNPFDSVHSDTMKDPLVSAKRTCKETGMTSPRGRFWRRLTSLGSPDPLASEAETHIHRPS